MKKQRRGLNRCNVLYIILLYCINEVTKIKFKPTDTMYYMTDGNPWSVKQHNWKSEAKEDNKLGPSGPSDRRKLKVTANRDFLTK